ncbi:glycosyltransferase [Naasia lichenicola]|uniref:Glycosyltransferase family 2 protein n=1 Tax=Naasia lichenicola TaxID=2565933 RepID=A0A4S4FKB6_9MICO|nr:glycosyltransferase [Naasia lichenicola]THG30830.1 glycosyltransferase family 2 protein [Naasia lichenicola]
MTPASPAAPVELQLLQRVILPLEHDPGVLPLYVDADYWTTVPLPKDARAIARREPWDEDLKRVPMRVSDFGELSDLVEDSGFRVPRRRKVSFGTYFNAFPASYWKRWTSLESVVLRVATTGVGQIMVYRSNARGVVQQVDSSTQREAGAATFELPFTFFGDGGWYWFDLIAEEDDFALTEAGWHAPAGSAPTRGRIGTASIGITTLNRGEYCAKLLADIGAKPDVVATLDRIYVVDQGSEKIVDAPGFDVAKERLGDKLQVIEQGNIGGSGGFSRGMFETVDAGESDYVLLLDDDIAIEPESIRRAVRFADYTVTPTIVGGHMFDMYDRSKLHAFAETIEMNNFIWGPATPGRHDLGASNLRQTRWMHKRFDVTYNGWWMSLIPVEIVKEIGLSLPVFIKWDDAEYSLRAADHGYATVTLPGAAVWHVSWVDKDDSQDWQAFYHARNRLIAALLHSPMPRGGRLQRANFATDLRHLLTMQYFAAAARIEAYRNVLAGPEALFSELDTRLGKTRALAGRFSEGSPIRDLTSLPSGLKLDRQRVETDESPTRLAALPWLLRTVARHFFSPASADDKRPAQAHLAFATARWWVTPDFDSVLVSNAEGSAVLWHRRDRRIFRAGLLNALRFAYILRREWPQLSSRYRSSLSDLVSVETWGRYFEQRGRSPR